MGSFIIAASSIKQGLLNLIVNSINVLNEFWWVICYFDRVNWPSDQRQFVNVRFIDLVLVVLIWRVTNHSHTLLWCVFV